MSTYTITPIEIITGEYEGLEAIVWIDELDAERPYRVALRDTDADETVQVVRCPQLSQALDRGRQFVSGEV